MSRLTILALAFILAGCSLGSESGGSPERTTQPRPVAQPIRLIPTPVQALRRCRRFPVLARACPRLVPKAGFETRSPLYRVDSFRGAPAADAWTFTLQWGGEHPDEPERDRPPETVHVVVLAGDLPRRPLAFGTDPHDGLLEESRSGFFFLGRTRWGGRSGTLLLAPPYGHGGIEGNHLVFRWRENGVVYRVSLHGWEPFSEVPNVLQAVVESIPARLTRARPSAP